MLLTERSKKSWWEAFKKLRMQLSPSPNPCTANKLMKNRWHHWVQGVWESKNCELSFRLVSHIRPWGVGGSNHAFCECAMRFNYSIAKKEWCFELSAIFWGQKKISLFAQGNEPPRPPFSAVVFDWLRGGLSEMDMFLKTAFFKCPLHDSTFMRDADIKTQNPPRSQLFFDVFALA